MANLRYLTLNLALTATLSASPAVLATFPQANMARQERTLVCRTLDGSIQQLKYSWSTNQSINMAALWYHNLTSASTWRVQIYSDSAFTTQIYDSGTVNAFGYTGISANAQQTSDEFRIFKSSAIYFALLTTAKSMVISVTDTGNASGYMEFSHAFVGKYAELSSQPAWGGATAQVVNTTINERSDDMSNISDKGGAFIKIEINHDFLLAADREDLETAMAEVGRDKLIWVSIYPGDGTAIEMRHQHAVKIADSSPLDAYQFGTLKVRLMLDGN